jgi:hypothetical protein
MRIYPETHLLNVQLAFREKFPYLKLEFFKHLHEKNELSSYSDEVIEDLTIMDFNPDFAAREWYVSEKETVSEFENRIAVDYGLPIQVCRKSGNIWIQTSKTDAWTLEKQQQIAMDEASLEKDYH